MKKKKVSNKKLIKLTRQVLLIKRILLTLITIKITEF